ncbi:MAG: hypothetical protein ABTQ34_03530 [Bdellovibrionales bacterium]
MASSSASFNPELAQVLDTLRELMLGSGSDTARIAAAKILLERIASPEDEEARRREDEERQAALTEAYGLLAELAVAQSAGVHEPGALAQDRAAFATDAAE